MSGKTGNIVEGDIDQIVYDQFFSGKTGVFVDVGAARPDFLSISALFREKKWRVIAVEPNPDFFQLQKDAGVEAIQCACGAHDEDDVEFTLVLQDRQDYMGGVVSYESFSSLGIKKEFSDLKSNLNERKIRVKVRRLDTILAERSPPVTKIDVLSIDVEGWEMEVLNGLNLSLVQPRVIVLENLFRSQDYVDRVVDDGYVLWKRSYPNDVYITSRSPLLVRKVQTQISIISENFCSTVSRFYFVILNRFKKVIAGS